MRAAHALGVAALLLMLAAAARVRAEPFHAGQMLDKEQVARVAGAALAFMAPRILEPIPISQLTLWGLRGLTTLDPRLRVDVQKTSGAQPGSVRLTLAAADGERLLLAGQPPSDQDAAGWAAAAATVLRAGWDASQAVRRVGSGGVIRTFFDELFNHLDPYSRYAPPAEAAQEQEARAGVGGVGLALVARGSGLWVRTVEAGSPAANAGIRPGERVLAIDGQEPADTPAAEAEAMLAGPEDSDVALTVGGRDGRARSMNLRRTVVVPETVRASRAGALLVVRISGFSSDTGRRLAAAVARAARPRPRALVIDLRGNRGGLLAQAVEAAGAFLAGGIVATTDGRDPLADHRFRAEGRDLAPGLPVIVLVDGRSASASEVLAAALADQHRAVVVGSATLGKGLVQTIDPLPDGGALYLTWSRILAPLGWPIQGLGVLPQVCTSLGQTESAAQLAALAQGVQPMEAALARHRNARPSLPAAEALEIRAACPGAEGRDLDMTAARFLAEHPTAYRAALLGPPAYNWNQGNLP